MGGRSSGGFHHDHSRSSDPALMGRNAGYLCGALPLAPGTQDGLAPLCRDRAQASRLETVECGRRQPRVSSPFSLSNRVNFAPECNSLRQPRTDRLS